MVANAFLHGKKNAKKYLIFFYVFLKKHGSNLGVGKMFPRKNKGYGNDCLAGYIDVMLGDIYICKAKDSIVLYTCNFLQFAGAFTFLFSFLTSRNI